MHVIAGKAVCFKEALTEEFNTYQKQVIENAKALCNALIDRGFTIVSGGTDNHLMNVDLRNKQITGKDAEHLLDEIGITCNKNTIPFDPESPFVTSGIRLGTPAVTTRGMKEEDMTEIADIMSLALSNFEENKVQCKERVATLLEKYPLY